MIHHIETRAGNVIQIVSYPRGLEIDIFTLSVRIPGHGTATLTPCEAMELLACIEAALDAPVPPGVRA